MLGDQSAPPVNISVGYDTTQRAQTADEEKYFMREYMPGDRMKDINWKASSRLDQLNTGLRITRQKTLGDKSTASGQIDGCSMKRFFNQVDKAVRQTREDWPRSDQMMIGGGTFVPALPALVNVLRHE